MPLQIIRNDISKVKADAIVNTANPEVAVGAGVDEAIYKAAGAEQLLAERAKIGHLDPGQAAVTPAFALDAKYIIHTVGPAWIDGNHSERETVASCYKESLRLADEKGCESVAFPLISTGTFGFPKDEALKIAINEISSFLFDHEMTVYMVVYDKESFVLSGKAFQGVRTYIEEKDVRPRKMSDLERERRNNLPSSLIMKSQRVDCNEIEEHYIKGEKEDDEYPTCFDEIDRDEDHPDVMMSLSMPVAGLFGEVPSAPGFDDYSETLGEAAERQVETFQQLLFRHIDRKGYSDPDVYKRANLSRKLFSKIRSDVNYRPNKNTVLSLAIALRLNLDETMDFLQRAGYALSPAIDFDRIIAYCIKHRIYDIFEIDTYLFNFTDRCLAG
ncbi:MAG: macro domain-containing protein [Bacillota bacterium]